MYIYISSLVILLVGLAMWYRATNPKTQEVGKTMFQVGLLAFLLTGAPALIQPFIGPVRR